MKILRWLLRIVVALVVLVVALLLGARLHDGPLGPIPGGSLASGEWVDPVSPDWSFAKDVAEIELQLESQSTSRTTWILVRDGKAWIPCSLSYPPGKTWYKKVAADGRAVLRIDGRRYAVTLAQLGKALFRVRMRRRRLSAQVGGGVLGLVAGGLHLLHERELVRRQAGLDEHVDVEGLGLRVGGGLLHPLLQVLEGLGEQANRIVVLHQFLPGRGSMRKNIAPPPVGGGLPYLRVTSASAKSGTVGSESCASVTA